jgi:ATP-dependent Lhr-like helicase
MLRHPPEILITTPESLNLMLTGKQSRQLFGGLAAVILDEIHALAGSKRGQLLDLSRPSGTPKLLPPSRTPVPPPEPVRPVPRRFRSLQGQHEPHPGTARH